MNPIAFLFAHLGATGFWAAYVVLSFVVSAILMRHIASTALTFIVSGPTAGRIHRKKSKDGETSTQAEAVFYGLIHLVFWPIITTVILGYYLCQLFLYLIKNGVIWGFKLVDKLTPNIKIKIDKEG